MSKLKTVFAVIGIVAILALIVLFGRHFFQDGSCETTAVKTLTTQDQSVKATAFRRDCGASARTRTLVALSNPNVDGVKDGEVVLTLSGVSDDASIIRLEWQTNRKQQITYPKGATVEYAVTKTHGVEIDSMPSLPD
jgi:hypothetical protein